MLRFLKRNKEKSVTKNHEHENTDEGMNESHHHETEKKTSTRTGIFSRLASSLKRTRVGLADGLANILHGKKVIDDQLLEEIEAKLLSADVGVQVTQHIISTLTKKISHKQLNDAQALFQQIVQSLEEILLPCEQAMPLDSAVPYVVLMVGVNGAGKTTTIGKLAKQLQAQGKKVMLAAGDTFRAAAIEQLQVWGDRNNISVVAQQSGSDSASVIFDALQSATAKSMDILLADTAGRLHTQQHLMQELKKIKKVMRKINGQAPHEVLLILDASIGQNALMQAKQFHEALGVTGLVITKLDGTAKGGVIFSIAKTMKIPIRYIGVGESIDDLRVFCAKEFVAALFAEVNIGQT